MGLGGVERFCFDLAKNMVKWGIKASYVGFQYETHSMMDNTLPYYGIDNRDGYFLLDCMEFMIESKAKYIIANYSLEFMQAASIVKKHYNPSLKIVGIIHCEDEIPFQQYRSRWDDIDLVWAISSRIEKRLLECGVSKEKINKLTWHIQVPPMEKREYSKEGTPIKVGYAGRIEKEQKRMDYIVPIAMALKKKNVKFKLQIAGTGAYEEELKKQILSHGLNQEIELLGLVEHDKILDFWLKQDVCLSCSDFEGHSITHSEAIAVGAVPVLTNTSGAEDDVIDGETGYIVDIGDFEAIADKIAILYQDKRRLKTYGRKILELKQKNSYQKQCEQYETWKKFFSY
jgi:glycosyltransferase involved in cell wall biosynthesis